jgi:hypothetical protein
MSSPPILGSTTIGACSCNKFHTRETTWAITSEYAGRMNGISNYSYYWTCLNCGKKREIGKWDENGKRVS